MNSIGISMTVRGADEATASTLKEIDKMMGEFIQVFIACYRKMFEGSRSGHLYRKGSFGRGSRVGGTRARGQGRRMHRASAPGEPLAKESGKSMNAFSVRRLKSGVYRIRFGGGAMYWEFRDAQARPTVMPALEEASRIYFG